MKKLLLIALVATAGLGATAAEARDGCGAGFHAGPRGRCIANRVGGYYRNHGYWDGRRYYRHRERFNGGWRYR